jgi:hypothetical protein
MHRFVDGMFCLNRPGCPRLPVLLVAALLASSVSGGCAALTNPVADGVSVRRLPPELLEPSKEGEQTIPLALLGQPRPAAYRLAPGDVLGVYVEGFLGERDQPVIPPVHIDPPVALREQRRLPPAAGYPVPVEDNGEIFLPSAGTLLVQGMSLPEAREAIRRLYIDKRLLRRESERVIVSLLFPRQYHVVVMRQEAASFTSPNDGPAATSKRGTGYVVDLPAYENDVLHALAQTGGLPGLDAYDGIVIQRNCFHSVEDRKALVGQLEVLPSKAGTGAVPCAGGEVIRVPFRCPHGAVATFPPEEIILQTGDVVFLEARDQELFYTGGLLPTGVFVLPRDHDLDVIEAVARVRGPLINGAFGGSNLAGNLIAPGIGGPSPTLLSVLRRTPGGGQVPIVVDLRSALRHPEERLLVRAGDTLILQEKPSEALARYFTQTFFNFDLVWQVIHDKFATGVVDVSTPDRLTPRLPTVPIPLP